MLRKPRPATDFSVSDAKKTTGEQTLRHQYDVILRAAVSVFTESLSFTVSQKCLFNFKMKKRVRNFRKWIHGIPYYMCITGNRICNFLLFLLNCSPDLIVSPTTPFTLLFLYLPSWIPAPFFSSNPLLKPYSWSCSL